MKTIIITRHKALIEYIFEIGLCPADTPVIPHAVEQDIIGNRCIGPLPLNLAALAAEVINIPIKMPQELRGVELSLEQLRMYAKKPETYVVTLK